MILVWRVLLSVDVQLFFGKQDKAVAEKLRKRLQKLKTDDPFHYLEHFEGQDFYKFRLGEYRALIDVDFVAMTIFVRILDHRSVIYKRKP